MYSPSRFCDNDVHYGNAEAQRFTAIIAFSTAPTDQSWDSFRRLLQNGVTDVLGPAIAMPAGSQAEEAFGLNPKSGDF
jgi:hypothetical protein